MSENVIPSDVQATAVIDLLGMLAFAELLAFDRMASDARLAPDLHRRAVMSEMAAMEIANYRRLASRLTERGVDPQDAMAPFVTPLSEYHDMTDPSDWYEGLAKAYFGGGIADDFIDEVATSLKSPDRELIVEIIHDSRYADFAVREVREATTSDPKIAHRLSMWARRLVGEGLSQALRVAADRPALAALLVPNSPDAAECTDSLTGLFRRLTSAHTARMTAVGLNN